MVTKAILIFLPLLLLSGCEFFEQKVNIRLFHYRNEISRQFGILTDVFQKKYPKITVEIEYVPYVEPYYMLQRFIERKNVPDIIMLHPYSVLYDFAKEGYLTDLSNEKFNENVFDQVKDGISYKGKIYAYPFNLEGFGLLYNRQVFGNNDIQIPSTFKNLESITDIFRKKNIIPFAVSIKDSWTLGYLFAMAHSASLGNNDDAVNEFAVLMNSGKGSFDNENTADIFNVLDFYKDNGGNDAIKKGWNDQIANFAGAKCAMMLQNTYSYSIAKSMNPSLEAGLTGFPFTEDESESKIYAGVDSVFSIPVQQDKNKIRAAKKFLDFLSSTEGRQMMVEDLKMIPALKQTDVKSLDKPYRDLYESFINGKTTMESFRIWNSDAFEYSKQLVQDYYYGKTNRSKFINVLDDKWKKSINK